MEGGTPDSHRGNTTERSVVTMAAPLQPKPKLSDRVASAVVKQFESLRPRGKPQGREWTVLAGLVVEDTTVSRRSAGRCTVNLLYIGISSVLVQTLVFSRLHF